MFDQDKDPSTDYHYLDCKAAFLHFSSRCLAKPMTDMLQCNRGDQPLDYSLHTPPTNIVLKRNERWWNLFKNDMVVHSQVLERTGTCDLTEVKQVGTLPKCTPYEELNHVIDINVESKTDVMAAVMFNFVSNDMRIELMDSKDKVIVRSNMVPYLNTYFGA